MWNRSCQCDADGELLLCRHRPHHHLPNRLLGVSDDERRAFEAEARVRLSVEPTREIGFADRQRVLVPYPICQQTGFTSTQAPEKKKKQRPSDLAC